MAMAMCGESFYRYDNGNVLGVFLSVWQWQCVGSLFIGMKMAMCGESFYRYYYYYYLLKPPLPKNKIQYNVHT